MVTCRGLLVWKLKVRQFFLHVFFVHVEFSKAFHVQLAKHHAPASSLASLVELPLQLGFSAFPPDTVASASRCLPLILHIRGFMNVKYAV